MGKKSICRKPTYSFDAIEKLNCEVMDELMYLNTRMKNLNGYIDKKRKVI